MSITVYLRVFWRGFTDKCKEKLNAQLHAFYPNFILQVGSRYLTSFFSPYKPEGQRFAPQLRMADFIALTVWGPLTLPNALSLMASRACAETYHDQRHSTVRFVEPLWERNRNEFETSKRSEAYAPRAKIKPLFRLRRALQLWHLCLLAN